MVITKVAKSRWFRCHASLIAIASILFEINKRVRSRKPTSERSDEIFAILRKEKSKFTNSLLSKRFSGVWEQRKAEELDFWYFA